MTVWLAVLAVTAIYLALLCRIAFWLGGLLAAAEAHLERNEAPAPVRCECRRYAFPSPICPIHGRKEAA